MTLNVQPPSPVAKKARTSATKAAPPEKGEPAKNPHGLPPMISPTLPPKIEEELVKAEQKKKESNAKPGKLSSDQHTPISKSLGASIQPNKRERSPSGSKPSVSRERSLSNGKQEAPATKPKPPPAKDQPRPQSPLPKSLGTKHEGGKSTGPSNATIPAKSTEKSHVVKFKIPKSIRKNVSWILQMKPTPKKPEPTKPNGTAALDQKGERLKAGALPNDSAKKENLVDAAGMHGQKRRIPDDENLSDASNKRQKAQKSTVIEQNPRTPINKSVASPAQPHVGSTPNSTQKPQLATPNAKKGTAMHRITSSEGDAKTPMGHPRGGGTPNGPPSTDPTVNRDGRPVSSASSDAASGRSEESAAWSAESQKYNTLGRKIKHEADAALKSDSSAERKRGLALAVETVICYMLAFALSDESSRTGRKPPDLTGWRSLLAYIRFAKTKVLVEANLMGLVQQLEALAREILHMHELERLERDVPALPSAAGSPPNPKATSGDGRKGPMTADLLKTLAADYRTMRELWRAGYAALPLSVLEKTFPKTWARRSEDTAKNEKLTKGEYIPGAGFGMPLSSVSHGIEGVRMGWSVLREWSKNGDVGWKGTIATAK